MTSRAHLAHQRSLADPDAFWLSAAEAITWHKRPSTALQVTSETQWQWFPDGELNVCANALDRHVAAGRGDNIALIYESAMTGESARVTYKDLLKRVTRFAGGLRQLGVEAGDRVLLFLPMTPEAVVAMLACARLGAIHSVVFGGFAAPELATRITDARPKVVVTSSGGIEPTKTVPYLPIVSRALEIAGTVKSGGSVESVVVFNRAEVAGSAGEMEGQGDIRWIDGHQLEATAPSVEPVPMPSASPLYILYTSGTSGNPKGIVRDTAGHAVALAWAMENIYGVSTGDVMFTASDVGWVVGHSFIVYGPLLAGATTVLYEGKPVGTPDAGSFWRVAASSGAKVMFTAPTALRAIRREDPELSHLSPHDLSSLEALFVAGERIDPDTWHWIHDGLGIDVIDNWWQTETGWPICANPRGLGLLPVAPGSAGTMMPGFDVRILDRHGKETAQRGAEGNIALRLPLPPGALTGIWGDPNRFATTYLQAFPGHYSTGDAGYLDNDGFLVVMGRTDDVINVSGHRLSTGLLEEAIAGHSAVAECAVVGAHDPLSGQYPIGFVTLQHGHEANIGTVSAELIALVREHVGPVAAFKNVVILNRLPKTRSGKILRRVLRQIADGEPPQPPATIEDLSVVDDVVAAWRSYLAR